VIPFHSRMADKERQGTVPNAVVVDNAITFHYVKSNAFRVVHADGAVVSVGPQGIFFSLYSERVPIPQAQTFAIEGEKLGAEDPDKRVVRSGVVREVEVGVAMSMANVESLINTLRRQLNAAKKALAESPAATPKDK
jgi:hypothetical protein